MNSDAAFRVLSLDGGGARGIYTLGVLEELEATMGQPLWRTFDLMYGTSTGAIIVSLLALGMPAAVAAKLYLCWIPKIFSTNSARERSKRLRSLGQLVFEDKGFDVFQTRVGIVTTDCEHERPRIFKSHVEQTFSRAATFQPGFGAKILDAVQASAAAVPFFEQVRVATANQGNPMLMDGGFVANNPTIYAMTDAMMSLKVAEGNIRVLSVGTGQFAEPRASLVDRVKKRLVDSLLPADALMRSLNANSASVDWLASNLFRSCSKVRVHDARSDLEVGILCSDPQTLQTALTFGRDSFGKHESEIVELLK